jgi:hypothetical protein
MRTRKAANPTLLAAFMGRIATAPRYDSPSQLERTRDGDADTVATRHHALAGSHLGNAQSKLDRAIERQASPCVPGLARDRVP